MAQIKWANSAYDDLEEIGRFIALESTLQADRVVADIVDTPKMLIDYPEIGRIVPELSRKHIRELIYGNYRIIYFLNKDIANIIAIHHSARKFIKKDVIKRTKKI
jgi:toxin ParE1/3/4